MRRISSGPLATVYQAFDTVLGTRVALKIPTDDGSTATEYAHEARVANKIEHPNILPIRDAGYIDGHFVIVMALGEESLADRIERRLSRELALNLAGQALDAVAHAHSHNVIHCDIKPENFILFPDNRLKLCDFGFAKISARTVKASGSGTIDFIAPEQAMGRPRLQSDVFSLGLVLCRLIGGKLPEWPFDWPPAGYDRLQRWLPAPAIAVLRRSIEIDLKKRYPDAVKFRAAFRQAMRSAERKQKKKTSRRAVTDASWKSIQGREFRRRFGKALPLGFECRRCDGPVGEAMLACPWCGTDNPTKAQGTDMPMQCPRCERGVKRDWRYCPWCYGRGFVEETTRRYPDKRYTHRCSNLACRGPLMRFMKYCPWCRTKVTRHWPIDGSSDACRRCGNGVAAEFWSYCAWCSRRLKDGVKRTRQSGAARR